MSRRFRDRAPIDAHDTVAAPDTPVGGSEAAAVQAGWRAALANADAAGGRVEARPVSRERVLRALSQISTGRGVVAVAVADSESGALQGLVSDDHRLDLAALCVRLAPQLAAREMSDDLVMDVRGGSVVVRPVRNTCVFMVAVLARGAQRAAVRSRMRAAEVELAGMIPRLGPLAMAR